MHAYVLLLRLPSYGTCHLCCQMYAKMYTIQLSNDWVIKKHDIAASVPSSHGNYRLLLNISVYFKGHWTPVDVCSIYTPEIFTQWAFNCQYGFAGNVLKFMTRYSALGSRKIEAAFLKALTSSKLRQVESDIKYDCIILYTALFCHIFWFGPCLFRHTLCKGF